MALFVVITRMQNVQKKTHVRTKRLYRVSSPSAAIAVLGDGLERLFLGVITASITHHVFGTHQTTA